MPSEDAQGPWGPIISGHVIGGVFARAVEQADASSGFEPARLTVDLLRPTALKPLEVRTSVVREGKRIRMIDAAVIQDDTVVARASAVLLLRGEQPPGEVWSSPIEMPPLPADPGPLTDEMPMWVWGYGGDRPEGALGFNNWQDATAPKYAWIRQVRRLVAGEETTPFVDVSMAADATSALSHWSSQGLRFINVDYTLTLSRLPRSDYIGLAALTHTSHDGVASGVVSVFDQRGVIGNAMAAALVNPADSFRPPIR